MKLLKSILLVNSVAKGERFERDTDTNDHVSLQGKYSSYRYKSPAFAVSLDSVHGTLAET